MLNYCGKFHYNQLVNKGVTIQDGRQMDYVLCFFGLYVINRLRDGWANRAETWWNGREHTRECPRKDFFLFLNPRWPSNGLYSKKTNYAYF